MSSLSNSKKIIRAWIEKGDLENDDFSKFICYWVAFNCWLYTKTDEIQDRKALKKMYDNQNLCDNFSKLVRENDELINGLILVCPIRNNKIKNRKKTIDNKHSLKEVVDVIYEIRCNLFHGSKADWDKRDKEVIDASVPVLKLIVKNICFN